MINNNEEIIEKQQESTDFSNLKFISKEDFYNKLKTYLDQDFISKQDFNSLDEKLKKLVQKKDNVDYDFDLLKLEIQLEEQSVSYRHDKKGEFSETFKSILEQLGQERGIVNIHHIFTKGGVPKETKDNQVKKFNLKIKELAKNSEYFSVITFTKEEKQEFKIKNLELKNKKAILNFKEFQKELTGGSYKLKFISTEDFEKKLNDYPKIDFLSEEEAIYFQDTFKKLCKEKNEKKLDELEYDFQLLKLNIELELEALSVRKEKGLLVDILYQADLNRLKLQKKALKINELYYIGWASKERTEHQLKEYGSFLVELNIEDQQREDFLKKEFISKEESLDKRKYKSNFKELLKQGLISETESIYQIEKLPSIKDVDLSKKFSEIKIKTIVDAENLLANLEEAWDKRKNFVEINDFLINLIAAVSNANLKKDEAFEKFEKKCEELEEKLINACARLIFLENRRLFNKILSEELKGCEYSCKDREKYPNLFLMMTFINTLTAYVLRSILTDIEEKKSIAKRMEFWINVAYTSLYTLGDTNAAFAITAAFLRGQIFRLRNFKEKMLSSEAQKKLEELQKLFCEPTLLVQEWLENKPDKAAKNHYPIISLMCTNLVELQARIADGEECKKKEISQETWELLKKKNMTEEEYRKQISEEVEKHEKKCQNIRDNLKNIQQNKNKDDFPVCEYYSHDLLQKTLVFIPPTEKFLINQSRKIEEPEPQNQTRGRSKSTLFIPNKKSENKEKNKRSSFKNN